MERPQRALRQEFPIWSCHRFAMALDPAPRGEVAEWSNAAVLKTVERESVPRVRIPVSPPLIPVSLQLCFLTRNCAAIPASWRMRFQSETEQTVHSERNSGRSLSVAFWRGRFGRDFPDTRQFTGKFRETGLISVISPIRTVCFSEVYVANSLKSGTGNFLVGTGNCSDGSGRAKSVSGTQDLEMSEAEQAFLFGPIKWVGHADQTLECKFGRLGAVENRGLNLR